MPSDLEHRHRPRLPRRETPQLRRHRMGHLSRRARTLPVHVSPRGCRVNYAPTITGRPDAPPKCCARCKTPWFCGNDDCKCHGVCAVDECSKPRRSALYCSAHQMRLDRYGSPDYYPRGKPKPWTGIPHTEEGFWSLVEVTGACWYWQGGLTPEGYGYWFFEGRTSGVHRIAHRMLTQEEVPSSMHIDHLCRTRNCVNPDHMEVVTPEENSRRANRPKVERTHCTHGHEWTPGNTLPLGTSKRCRQCLLVRSHRKRGLPCTYDSFCDLPSHHQKDATR